MKGGSLMKNMDRGKMSEAIHMDRGKMSEAIHMDRGEMSEAIHMDRGEMSEAIHSQGKTQQVQLRLPFAVAKLHQQVIRDHVGVTNVARHR